MFAAQEAKDLGSREIGTEHLLLGMLGNARSPLFTVLTEQGLTLAAARDVVRQGGAADAEDIRDRYEEDREALRSIGIDLDKVRAAVGDRFGEDLSDGWGQRADRGRGRGRGRPHARPQCGPGGWEGPGLQAQVGPDGIWFGPWEGGRGRRGPRGRGRGSRMSEGARESIRVAVTSARDNQEHDISVERVLLAILDGADPAAVAVVESATTVEALRTAVLATLPEATATR
ncbi:Clp domain-containing protein [Gordonia neofelifaecis NRRL B-59395]|uniref:Clp domain-containing protein n=2 Tax=Gordonia TaxID=2053 RepID=F1YIN9_9ACTN|nr:Clp domain-containing protein [Gordonia neofelifaecis NRRL B-59395]